MDAAVSVQKPPLTDMAQSPGGNGLPELNEKEYMSEVLELSIDNFEAYFESLMARAVSLGISLSRPSTGVSTTDKHDTPGAESSATPDFNHSQIVSPSSEEPANTALTPLSSKGASESAVRFLTKKRSKALTFAEYENYLAQADPHFKPSKYNSVPPSETHYTPSLLSASTRRSLFTIKRGLSRIRSKRNACRDDATPEESLIKLPCGHSYCSKCLRIMIKQATTEETRMPPRCCTQPIPSSVIRAILSRDEQIGFLKAVLQFSTPWESRIFCCKPGCGEFIPPRDKVDPMNRFEAAQFCYICGARWDAIVGCPNYCNGEAEMERRRQEEQARILQLAAEESAKQKQAAEEALERLAAEIRTRRSPELQLLRAEQAREMQRFQVFEKKSKWLMCVRHTRQKLALAEKHSGAIEKMKDRHARTAANLEDRQVAAEMDLRTALEQSAKNVRVRLRHMEAYCDRLGQKPDDGVPARVVTERDLRELGQQYNLEKNMKQLHQAKINVMRDRQAKALEELLERQENEMQRATEKNSKEMENVESACADEEDTLLAVFSQRKAQLTRRWEICIDILLKELESATGLKYAPLGPPQWPQETDSADDVLLEGMGE
ncbi:hypothetical protein DL765_010049 [Monosporascus sp. GIB2]|nr:hypothetical protein DL765_010049 [Monosporascus sp. GIB2]